MNGEDRPRRSGFPWLLLFLLLATIGLFWVLPFQMGQRPVQVEFEEAPAAPASPPATSLP